MKLLVLPIVSQNSRKFLRNCDKQVLQKSIYLNGSILAILFMDYIIRIIIYPKGQVHGSAIHVTTVNTVECKMTLLER